MRPSLGTYMYVPTHRRMRRWADAPHAARHGAAHVRPRTQIVTSGRPDQRHTRSIGFAP